LLTAPLLTAQFRVTPDGGSLTVPLNSTEKIARFTLYTGVNTQQTWHITPNCSGVITNCWSPSGYDLTFIQATGVDIKFSTPSAGSGTVTLTASRLGVSDGGSYNVTVDGTLPESRLLAPTGDVSVEYPTIQLAWCDDNALNAGSRWIKVNGVLKTSSFDYVANSGPPDCTAKATSTTSSVALVVGTNTIATYICDNAANCAFGSFPVTRVTYGVAVTPDGATAPQRPANSSGYTENFTVQNTGSSQNTFSLVCSGSSNVTCTGLTINGTSVTSVSLAGGAGATVVAAYNVGAVGTGSLSLAANGTNASDNGTFSVPVITPSAQPPVVDINSVNPGIFVERGLCLAIAAGTAAASECGDLRMVHPLPTTRTMNKGRTPTLLYNSQTAHPFPIIAANVTIPLTAPVPDSVTGLLQIGNVTRARTKWLGNQWSSGQTRRVGFAFDALGDATGVYAYTLEIRNWYPDPTPSQPTTVNGELVIVNRSDSPFGAGWWLAGLEQLFWIPDGRKLVVLGDGSARVYSAVASNLYAAANPTRPDTLDGRGTDYVRLAQHGVRVHFSSSTGKHISTTNRLSQETDFAYDQSCGRLSSISIPPGGSGPVYTFNYSSPSDCATRLVSVIAPGNRIVSLTDPSGKVTAITDPDNRGVSLSYDASFANRVVSRTDRRGNATFFGFDAGAKLVSDSLPLEIGQTPIVQHFRPSESLGLAVSVDTAEAYARVDGPRVDVNDTTAFWLDRFGEPRRIVDALGSAAVLKRDDIRWPALVTEMQTPNQFVTRATYDARGNDSTTTAVNPLGDGRDAVTRYHWDAKWDFVDSIISPMGVVTTMGYDPNNGNRLWQQVGGDAARRVSFHYGNAFGLLSATVLPQTPADSIEYDAGLGNLAATRTPRGFWTSYYKDLLGRDTLVVMPIDSTDKSRGGAADSTARLRQRTVFTVMDQDSIAEVIAPNRTEAVRTDKQYDSTGNLLSLARVSIPDLTSPAIGTITTRWRYDRANRRVAEVSPDGMVDSSEYDPSSNVIKAVTRRRDPTSGTRLTINMSYDPLNRLITRVLPHITYQSRPTAFYIQPPGSVWDAQPYPAYDIPLEAHTFTYDAMGQLLTADNADAKVKRSYYPSGLIKLDSLRIQTVARDDWERHKYGLEYTYDLDGRRKVLAVPHQLGIGNDTTIAYAYYLQIGLLETLNDVQRKDYTFLYNLRGDLSEVWYPWYSAYRQGLTYDPDGQLAADTIWNDASATYPRIQSAPLVRSTRFFYDARHKLQLSGESIQLRDTLRPTYSGLGNLKATTWSEWGCTWCQILPTDRHVTTESLTPDALGNVTQSNVTDQINGISYDPWGDQWHYQSSTSCCDTWAYQPGTGRMTTMSVAQQYPRSFFYDSAGNQEFSSAMDPQNGKTATERAAFFAADGSMRMVDARSAKVPHVYMGDWQTYVVEDYRYDALGRRIWVRARKWCDDYGKDVPAATECRVGVLRRIIWDGNQELAEIQMPWALQGVYIGGYDTTQQQQWWENDVNPVSLPLLNVTGSMVGDPNPFFGHVIYAGRRGTDHPIAITRVNYVMGMDWRYGNYGSQFIYNPPRVQAPFTVVPFWNARGDAPVGVFATGVQALCDPPDQYTACVAMRWPWNWSSSDRNGGLPHDYWHGTLLDGKRDGSGFRYMRNRYYDPLTGRFTQEDPLGLAGGLNAYGFAAGDPINFSDPFGLHPCSEAGNQDHDDYETTGQTDPTGKAITTKVHVDCSKQRALASLLRLAKAVACGLLGILPEGVTLSGGGAGDAVVGTGFVHGTGGFINRHGAGPYYKIGAAGGADVSLGGEATLTLGKFGGTAVDVAGGVEGASGGVSVNTDLSAVAFSFSPSANIFPINGRAGITHTFSGYALKCGQ